MVQTFRGNYVTSQTSFTATRPLNDVYFGTFFFSNDTTGDKVWALGTGSAVIPGKGTRSYTAGQGAYDRDPYASGTDIELFPFDIDGVQGAIKAKGDEKWITFRGMYASTITFTSIAGDGYGNDGTLSAAEKAFREGRGTWRYKMNREASMANSIPLSGIAGIDKAVSTITDKYSAGGLGDKSNQVNHSGGNFSII